MVIGYHLEKITVEIFIFLDLIGQIFKITDDNLSIDNYERSQFKMYPNPVKKNLQSL